MSTRSTRYGRGEEPLDAIVAPDLVAATPSRRRTRHGGRGSCHLLGEPVESEYQPPLRAGYGETVKPPILVWEGQDLMAFQSVERAEVWLETFDESLVIFDSEGLPLRLGAEDRR
jgi:hypothetical protein